MVDRVLLLNATFEPLRLVSLRRAVLLLIEQRAEPVLIDDEEPVIMHSPSMSISIPSVVRLTTYVRVPRQAFTPPVSRRGVLARDNYRCAYCGNHADTIDHVVPRSRGGAHTWTNVVAACKKHNHDKGNRLLEELGWELRITPEAPFGLLWRIPSDSVLQPGWSPFLRLNAA
jgi:hypothetical protein